MSLQPYDIKYIDRDTFWYDGSYDIYPNRTGLAKRILAGVDPAYIIEGIQERTQAMNAVKAFPGDAQTVEPFRLGGYPMPLTSSHFAEAAKISIDAPTRGIRKFVRDPSHATRPSGVSTDVTISLEQHVRNWIGGDWMSSADFKQSVTNPHELRGDDLLPIYHNLAKAKCFVGSDGKQINPAGAYYRLRDGNQAILSPPSHSWFFYQGVGEYATDDKTLDDWHYGIVQMQCRGNSEIRVRNVPCGATVNLWAFMRQDRVAVDIDKDGYFFGYGTQGTNVAKFATGPNPKTASENAAFSDVAWTYTEVGDIVGAQGWSARGNVPDVAQKYGSYTDKRMIIIDSSGIPHRVPRREFMITCDVLFVPVITLGNHTPGVLMP